MDLIERIDHWGVVSPERVVHESGGRRLSWGELKRKSDALAAYLRTALPGSNPALPGGRAPVAIQGHKEPEMLIGFLGALKAGHPYVPLDLSIPDERVKRIVATAGVGLLLGVAEIAAVTGGDAVDSAPVERVGLEPGDAVYIIFTSGSTGEPKGVEITAECLTHFVDWVLAEQGFTEQGEIFLNQAPFSFDLSVMDLYGALLTGGTLFSLDADTVADQQPLHEALARSGVTVWVSTPSFARMCAFSPGFGRAEMPALRKFWFCGERLPAGLAAELLKRFPGVEVWNTYGPTEATVAMTSVLVDPALAAAGEPLPVGRVMPGTAVLIRDEAGSELPEGESGEIVIAGPNVSPGYLGRPDLTASAFLTVNGRRAYRTGDIGRMSKGLLYCEGRRDDQVKIRGFRVELGEIDAALREHPRVREAVTVARETGGERELAAYIVPRGAVQGREVRAFLTERLPAYMVPLSVTSLEALPLTANGKLDRKRLPVPLAERLATRGCIAPPVDATQERLVEVWERVLEVSPVGIRDDFFDLGGQSLRAAEMLTEVEQLFGTSVSLAELFKAPTIEEFAKVLAAASPRAMRPMIEEIRGSGGRPPLFCVPGLIDLARGLGGDQPVYGFDFGALKEMADRKTVVRTVAGRWVKEIQAIQPHGPYYLLGHSFGGVLAFEAATQLMDRGEQVALLAMLDPDPPKLSALATAKWIASLPIGLVRRVLELSPAERMAYVKRRMGMRKTRFAAKLQALNNFAEMDTQMKLEALAAEYRARKYPARITLICGGDNEKGLGFAPALHWRSIGREVEVHVVPGDHMGMIRQPHVEGMARLIRNCIARAGAPLRPEPESELVTAKAVSGARNNGAIPL